jgi:biotin-(acetyl-CoA carboxylase) ligase
VGDRVVRGIATGIDERGALLIDPQDGGPITIHSGEMSELRLDRG